jgi:hypothetical protein
MVTGSRSWPADEWPKVFDVLDALLDERGAPLVILHGAAEGPDSWADEWATDVWGDVTAEAFPPDYDSYGKRAPHVRNDEMLRLADYVVAFWDGKSRGTKSVIDKAAKRGIEYEVHSPAGVYVEWEDRKPKATSTTDDLGSSPESLEAERFRPWGLRSTLAEARETADWLEKTGCEKAGMRLHGVLNDLAARVAALTEERDRLKTALDWIEAEPENAYNVQLWARAALGSDRG